MLTSSTFINVLCFMLCIPIMVVNNCLSIVNCLISFIVCLSIQYTGFMPYASCCVKLSDNNYCLIKYPHRPTVLSTLWYSHHNLMLFSFCVRWFEYTGPVDTISFIFVILLSFFFHFLIPPQFICILYLTMLTIEQC